MLKAEELLKFTLLILSALESLVSSYYLLL